MPPSKPSTQLTRIAFTMAVVPGKAEEYISRHKAIWPDLVDALKSHGVHNYSIFYHQATRQLFGYVEVEDVARWNAIPQTAACQRWWTYMSDIMVTNDSSAPASTALSEVFHLD